MIRNFYINGDKDLQLHVVDNKEEIFAIPTPARPGKHAVLARVEVYSPPLTEDRIASGVFAAIPRIVDAYFDLTGMRSRTVVVSVPDDVYREDVPIIELDSIKIYVTNHSTDFHNIYIGLIPVTYGALDIICISEKY